MSGASGPTVTCPKCKQGQMVKLAQGWTCNSCGFAPFAPKTSSTESPAPTPAPAPGTASAPPAVETSPAPAETPVETPVEASAGPPSPAPAPSATDVYASSPPPTYTPPSPPPFSFAPSPSPASYGPPAAAPPPAAPAGPAPVRPDGIPYTAPSRAGFAPRPLAPAPAVGGGNPVYTAGAADTAPSPYAPSASAARPAPVPAAPSAAPYNPQAPSKSVYAYSERQQLYAALPWRPAGGGLRFSRDVPLRTLPPGEPIYIEMFVHNQGNAPLATTYYIFLTNANLQGTKLQAESFDIPAGSVLDVSHTLAANLQPGEYHITVFCVPRTTRGRLQDPAVFPTLGPVDSSLPSGFPSLYEVLKIRTEVPCPNCGGRLLWTPAGVGGRPRAWVCGRCGNRVESGVA